MSPENTVASSSNFSNCPWRVNDFQATENMNGPAINTKEKITSLQATPTVFEPSPAMTLEHPKHRSADDVNKTPQPQQGRRIKHLPYRTPAHRRLAPLRQIIFPAPGMGDTDSECNPDSDDDDALKSPSHQVALRAQQMKLLGKGMPSEMIGSMTVTEPADKENHNTEESTSSKGFGVRKRSCSEHQYPESTRTVLTGIASTSPKENQVVRSPSPKRVKRYFLRSSVATTAPEKALNSASLVKRKTKGVTKQSQNGEDARSVRFNAAQVDTSSSPRALNIPPVRVSYVRTRKYRVSTPTRRQPVGASNQQGASSSDES